MDRLSAMHTFRRILELGSLKAAADEKQLSNAAVSKQLQDLERHLGAALLTRTTRRLSPTEAGQAYYQRCVQILDDVAEAEATMAAAQASPQGVLRVSAPMSFGLLHLSPLVPRFMRDHPQVKLDLVFNDRVVDLIDHGFDVAIRLRTTLPDSSLVAKKLGDVQRVLCASPAYLAARGTPACPEDLLNHRCLVYSLSADNLGEWTFLPLGVKSPRRNIVSPAAMAQATGQAEAAASVTPTSVKVTPALTINNSMALRDALLAGIGLSLIPNFVVQGDIAAGRLVPVLHEYEARAHVMHVVYPSSRHLSPKVRAFVDFLFTEFAGSALWGRQPD